MWHNIAFASNTINSWKILSSWLQTMQFYHQRYTTVCKMLKCQNSKQYECTPRLQRCILSQRQNWISTSIFQPLYLSFPACGVWHLAFIESRGPSLRGCRYDAPIQCAMEDIQFTKINIVPLVNKPYVNRVTLTGQNPPLKCCQPLEFSVQFLKGLDLLMLKISSM